MSAADRRAHYRSRRFLNREAELLDDWALTAWLDRLTDDVEYRVPIRQTRERGAETASTESFHYRDDYGSLRTRVERLEKPHSWSNNPPPRTRRHVSTVRVERVDGDELEVHSNLLLYRNAGDTTAADVLSAERRDRLREVDGDLKLARREALLDATVLGTEDLMVFL